MQQKLIALAVSGACSSLELAAAQGRAERRGVKCRTTVAIKVEVETIGDVAVGDLVAEALQEFIAAGPSTRTGKFESKAGLDVSWSVSDAFFDAAGNELEQKTRGIVPDTGDQA